ncbi:surface lipoprotein assembly modifier [Amphiplicatus metriothermophilus]|uniref:DUF481 domain-containing protein n=1 Tax=Amphiplicatus metriothermophilus TaxID=1519374 RepID=A0A239PW11_9PROT|nr:surface lipoprotein assembly modifier [Amphiplicatus metriothermophilus]MBB5519572.1 hypothetical protein [Amphiplicatus metriothermophilus]SNT74136.1 Protein of unknown function [Amphiplicatus metriothermophilus]
MRLKAFLFVTATIAAAGPHAAFGQSPAGPVKIDLEASAGVLVDSNVNVSDLDQNTGEGDAAAVLGAKLNAEVKPGETFLLRAGYEFSQILYQDFGDFDLQTHRLSGEAERDFKAFKLGALYNFVHARLDEDPYLDYQQISPYVSRLFGAKLFLRGAYAYTDKNFKTDDRRDSTGHSGQIDAFVFLNGLKRYLIVGGKVGGENARDDEFDLDMAGFKARYVQRVRLFAREAKLRAGADFERRDFTNVTASIGEKRKDEIFSAAARLELPVAGPAAIHLGYDYRDRDSNLPSADFTEHVAEMKLALSF